MDRKNWTLENNSVDSNNFFSPSQTIYPPALQCLPQYRWKRFLPPIHFLLAAFPPAISLPGMVVCDKAPFGGSSMGNKSSLHVLFRSFDAFGLYAMFKFEN